MVRGFRMFKFLIGTDMTYIIFLFKWSSRIIKFSDHLVLNYKQVAIYLPV